MTRIIFTVIFFCITAYDCLAQKSFTLQNDAYYKISLNRRSDFYLTGIGDSLIKVNKVRSAFQSNAPSKDIHYSSIGNMTINKEGQQGLSILLGALGGGLLGTVIGSTKTKPNAILGHASIGIGAVIGVIAGGGIGAILGSGTHNYYVGGKRDNFLKAQQSLYPVDKQFEISQTDTPSQ